MDRLILVNCAVLCIIFFYIGVVLSVPHNYETSSDNEKSERDKESYLWFGPRLGRRKRNPNGETYRHSDIDREQLATLMDVIQDSPWAIVAVNGNNRPPYGLVLKKKFPEGKRHTVNFTPRLGRDSGEEFSNSGSDRWLQDPEMSSELLSQRSPPFAPRLGRRLSAYSPRLGRQSDKNQMS